MIHTLVFLFFAWQSPSPEVIQHLQAAAAAERDWKKLLELEKEGTLAAQAHFGLAGLYRKQGKTEKASHEMEEYNKLQSAGNPPEGSQK